MKTEVIEAYEFVNQAQSPLPPFESLSVEQQAHYHRVQRFAAFKSNERARLLAVKLSYGAAELLTRPSTKPDEAVKHAMRYAGLEPIPIQVEVDGKVVAVS